MKFLLLLLTFLLGIQTPTEKWYFAWRDQTVIAFTASGETRPLASFDLEFARGYRLSATSALVTLYTDHEAQGLAIVTPDGVTSLRGEIDLEWIDRQGFDVLAYEHPYVVVTPNNCGFQWCRFGRPVWLVNIDALTIEVIADHVFVDSPQPLGLSGHLLRYARREYQDSFPWTLWERDLRTGQERSFYQFSSPIEDFAWPISLRTDNTGEFWYHSEPTVITAGEHPEFWRRLIRSDGSIEILDHIPEGEIPKYVWTLAGENILQQAIGCTRACRLDIRAASGGEWQTFTLSDNAYFEFVYPLSDGRVLARQYSGVIWILRESGAPLRMGVAHTLSPDFRWLLTAHDLSDLPTTYRVWDVQNERVVLEGIVTGGIDITYYEGGFLIDQYSLGMGQVIRTAARQGDEDPPPLLLYSHADGKTFEPPQSHYFDVLSDGSLLESRYQDGIYRVDLESGAETQILAAANVINLR